MAGLVVIREPAGRIAFFPLAWKAATRIELCKASRGMERIVDGLAGRIGLIEIRREEGRTALVENARFTGAEKPICLSIDGRTMVAISATVKLRDGGAAMRVGELESYCEVETVILGPVSRR